MKCALVGSKFFAVSVLKALLKEEGLQITRVVAPAADDRLVAAAQAAGIEVHVLANPKVVSGEAIPEGVDLIIAAHTHARVSNDALAHARLGGVGYHPSLLPRHRGIAAVEWTVLQGDPIAGGSVYHLADGWDAGAVAMQDWCFVEKGENARQLWERALAPMGLDLLVRTARHAMQHGVLPAHTQDQRFATKAPMIRRAVVLTDNDPQAPVSLVVTVMGHDRPGIVNALADTAERFGANWAASRMAHAAGEFAGMVHVEVPPENADMLTNALRELGHTGLQVMVAKSDATGPAKGLRSVSLELAGEDRKGIVNRLTRILAERGISISHIETEILGGPGEHRHIFKVAAQLMVPNAVTTPALQQDLEALARDLMMDVSLGEPPAAVHA